MFISPHFPYIQTLFFFLKNNNNNNNKTTPPQKKPFVFLKNQFAT